MLKVAKLLINAMIVEKFYFFGAVLTVLEFVPSRNLYKAISVT